MGAPEILKVQELDIFGWNKSIFFIAFLPFREELNYSIYYRDLRIIFYQRRDVVLKKKSRCGRARNIEDAGNRHMYIYMHIYVYI